MAKKSLGDSVLVAPFSGIVAQRHAQPGERVPLDAKIISVMDLARLELEAAVPAGDIGKVRVGQKVQFRIDGFGARPFDGRIERINPGTAAGSRSISVYAVIDNKDGLLRGGMFAQGAASLEQVESGLLVPLSAVREEAGQAYVYALGEGIIRRKAVKVGPSDSAGRAQVLEGLASGERIVRNNLGALREGAAVKVAAPAG
jgi:RND family efflux transporter MFP subunit